MMHSGPLFNFLKQFNLSNDTHSILMEEVIGYKIIIIKKWNSIFDWN